MKHFLNTRYFVIFSSYARMADPDTQLASAVTLSILQPGLQVAINAQTHALSTESDPWNG